MKYIFYYISLYRKLFFITYRSIFIQNISVNSSIINIVNELLMKTFINKFAYTIEKCVHLKRSNKRSIHQERLDHSH